MNTNDNNEKIQFSFNFPIGNGEEGYAMAELTQEQYRLYEQLRQQYPNKDIADLIVQVQTELPDPNSDKEQQIAEIMQTAKEANYSPKELEDLQRELREQLHQ